MHLEELFSRYAAPDGTPSERARVEEHLAGCSDCHALAEAFRDIDETLRRPAVPPSGWEAVERRVKRALASYRLGLGILVGLAIASVIFGGTILLRYSEPLRLFPLLLGCTLMTDTIVVVLLAMMIWERQRRLEMAVHGWSEMKREWLVYLEEKIRKERRRFKGVLFLWPGVLGVTVILSMGHLSTLAWAALFALTAVAVLDPWLTRRRLGRWLKEQEALRALAHNGE